MNGKFMSEEQKAASSSPYKLQIFGQAFVYQRRAFPKKELQASQFGPIETENWYNEFECQQLAVNYNGLYISEADFDRAWRELGMAVRQSMIEKGLIG